MVKDMLTIQKGNSSGSERNENILILNPFLTIICYTVDITDYEE